MSVQIYSNVNVLEPGDLFNDAEGEPSAVTVNGVDGSSSYAARRDHAHAGSMLALDIVTSETTVSNTAVETTGYTYTVPGGTLNAGSLLRLKLWVSYLQNSGGTINLNVRLKYGATTLHNLVQAPADSASRRPWVIEWLLRGDGAPNAQRSEELHNNTTTFGASVGAVYNEATAAEDSTQAKNLVVTLKWASADPNASATLRNVTLELLQAT